MHTHTCRHTHTNTHIHTHTNITIHTQLHSYTHTHTHTISLCTSMASLHVTSGVMVMGVLRSKSAILFLVHQALIRARGVVFSVNWRMQGIWSEWRILWQCAVACVTGIVWCVAASIDKYIAGRQEEEWKERKVTDRQEECKLKRGLECRIEKWLRGSDNKVKASRHEERKQTR